MKTTSGSNEPLHFTTIRSLDNGDSIAVALSRSNDAAVRLQVGGVVITLPLREWHSLAALNEWRTIGMLIDRCSESLRESRLARDGEVFMLDALNCLSLMSVTAKHHSRHIHAGIACAENKQKAKPEKASRKHAT